MSTPRLPAGNVRSRTEESSIDISIVSPVYNERGNLEPLHAEIRDLMADRSDTWEVIYVDDGSTDGSTDILRDISADDERTTVLRFRKNTGQSAALDAGADHASGDIVVFIDADGQNDPADIPRLIDRLGDGTDMVVGWRRDREDSLVKRVPSRIAAMLRRRLLGVDIHDAGCTLKAFRQDAVDSLDLNGEMHRYIPSLLAWHGYTVEELPVNHRKRMHGETKYGWKRLPKGFLDMLTVLFWKRFSDRPVHAFGGIGILCGVIGLIAGGVATVQKVVYGASLSDTALPLFAVFMVVIGIQFFLTGILADIMMRSYRQSSGDRTYDIAETF